MTELTKYEQSILDLLLSPDVKNIALGMEFLKRRNRKSRKEILAKFMIAHIGNPGKLIALTFLGPGENKNIHKYKCWFGSQLFTYTSKYTKPIEFWTVEHTVRIKPFFKDSEEKFYKYQEAYYLQMEVANNNDEYHLVRGDKAWVRLFNALQDLTNYITQHGS